MMLTSVSLAASEIIIEQQSYDQHLVFSEGSAYYGAIQYIRMPIEPLYANEWLAWGQNYIRYQSVTVG